MSGPDSIREYCEKAVVDWITKNAGVRKERIVMTRRFTEEPVNMSVVKVLNMMDELVKVYNSTYNSNIVLSQNWRLTHRVDKVGDFIEAFIDVRRHRPCQENRHRLILRRLILRQLGQVAARPNKPLIGPRFGQPTATTRGTTTASSFPRHAGCNQLAGEHS